MDVADGFPVRQVLEARFQFGQAVFDLAEFFGRLVFQRGNADGIRLVFREYSDVDGDADGKCGLDNVKNKLP